MTASANEGAPAKKYGMGGFWALIATQFQGAFNDNLFQYLIQFTIIAVFVKQGQAEAHNASFVASVSNIIFTLPFLIFVGVSGALSDRLSKQKIAVYVKYWEIFIVCFGFFAFKMQSPVFLWTMLFFMAMHSAFFSPAKYGILPEILEERKLSWGNGIIQMFTMLAIIGGVIAAGPIYDKLADHVHWSTVVLLTLSIFGLIMAHFISRPPAANPTQKIPMNPWSGVLGHFKVLYNDKLLLYTVIGYTYFWFAGALIRQNVMALGSAELHLTASKISYLNGAMAIGIGVGALTAGFLSRGRIELGLVPIGTFGLALFSALLAIPAFGFSACIALLAGLGFFAGFFDVPLAAMLQHRSPNAIKGGMMATTNTLTFGGIFLAGALNILMNKLGATTYQLFMINCAISLVVGGFMCVKLPMMPLRAILWLLTNTIYRVRVKGAENIPIHGGALLVSNHASFLDPGLISAVVDRPVRFLMHRNYYEKWWIKPIAKFFGAIPIAAQDRPKDIIESLKAAGDAIKAGELVCLFPEGSITRIGALLPFHKGFEHIMQNVDAPIIPIYLDGVWGSIFSFSKRRFFWKAPETFPCHAFVNIGKPVSAKVTPFELRQIVQELGADAYAEHKFPYTLPHRGFRRMTRLHPTTLAIADARSGDLSYFKALVGTIALARKLKDRIGDKPMVGALLPPSVGGALVNLAMPFMGRTIVNLNYTASAKTLAACANRCGITHCVTAKAFLERYSVEIPGEPVYLEDVKATITKKDQLVAALLAVFCPTRLLERLCGSKGPRSDKEIATVIFSSGSEGEPKGVTLTYKNVNTNVGSLAQVIDYHLGDVMMAFLPFFHSFGYTCTIWAPLTHGMSVVYHPSPLEPKTIGNIVKKYKAFFFVATPTFMQNFTRKCAPEDLQSVRFAICGAEKMPERIREGFKEKFGKEPLEAYGATECSPGISVCLPNYDNPGHHQRGFKKGTVGISLPGVAVRAVDPDTGKVLGPNEPGLIEIKGPNVMQGYLGMPEKTAAVIKDGWYSTGDIAFIDEEGFITITDRLARFSKVGGEMISHTQVEGTLHDLMGLTDLSMAVTGVPDDTRGERLVVLHILEEEQIKELLARLDKSDLPNLWKPRAANFHKVEAIPVLGTGKMDLKQVRLLALKCDSPTPSNDV